jgi:hypothetical protein
MTDTPTDLGPRPAPDSSELPRQATLERLSQHAIGADLTFDEYAERAAAIEQAATQAELDATLAGLPADRAPADAAGHGRWLVGAFGGAEERGRWRLGRRLQIVAFLGGVKVDLGNAQPEASESVITVVSILGGVDLLAPRGLPIELSGISLLGGKSDKRSSGSPVRGAPLIRVRALAVLGGVGIKDRKPPRRRLIDVIRRRRPQSSDTERAGPQGD